MGTPDANYLASVKAVQDNENERADAGQYESDIRQGVSDASAAANSAEGYDQARKMGVLNVTSDMYEKDQARPKWWQQVLGAASQVASGWATGGFKG